MLLKETYNRIAEDWHRDHQADDWWKEGTDEFVSLLGDGARVLDVGCGGGTKSKYLLARGLSVVGIDFSEKMVEIAARENPAGTFLTLDLKDSDQLPGEFDGIFLQAVLLHIPKREVRERLQRLANKLKPGGYFYIAVKEKRPGGKDEEVVVERDYGYSYERFFSYFTRDEVESHVREVGLSLALSLAAPTGATSWIQIIAKK